MRAFPSLQFIHWSLHSSQGPTQRHALEAQLQVAGLQRQSVQTFTHLSLHFSQGAALQQVLQGARRAARAGAVGAGQEATLGGLKCSSAERVVCIPH